MHDYENSVAIIYENQLQEDTKGHHTNFDAAVEQRVKKIFAWDSQHGSEQGYQTAEFVTQSLNELEAFQHTRMTKSTLVARSAVPRTLQSCSAFVPDCIARKIYFI